MRRCIPILLTILSPFVAACGGSGGGTNLVGGNTLGMPLVWTHAGRVPQSDGLLAIDRNGTLSAAVGTAGAIVIDTGDGQGWRAPARITRETLLAVVVVDANTIIAGGVQSIIRSSDKGATWTTVLDVTEVVRDLAARGNTVIAVLDHSMMRSEDAGETWNDASGINPNAPHGSVAFASADVAIEVSRDQIVSRTTDAGVSWNKITSLPTTGTILDVAFATPQDGAIIGTGGKLFWTNDAGLHWGQAVHSLLNDSAFKLSFVSSTRGYMLAQGREIHETQFAGQSWAQVATIPNISGFTPSDINALSTTHWIIVGSDGTTLETTDGGVTWNDGTEGERGTWFDIAFATPTLGVAAFRSTGQETVYRTANGGATWAALPFTQAPIGVARVVAFGSETHGIVAGSLGEAIATDDGGATWGDVDPGSGDINAIVALDENTYVIVGQQETLHRTIDLGANWVRVPFDLNNPTTYLDVARFPESDDLLAIGFDRGIFSGNGGQTWSLVSSDVVGSRAVTCPGGDVAIMAGAQILRSTNRGVDWTPVADPDENINVVTFGDGQHGIAVGDLGTIFETFDGGLTWQEAEPVTGAYLFAGTFRDPNTALIGGENGALLVGSIP